MGIKFEFFFSFNRAMYQYGEDAPCYSSVKMLEESLNQSLHCEDFKNWSYGIDNVDGSAVIRHHGIDLSQDDDKRLSQDDDKKL